MNASRSPDAVVIGAGLVGSATALGLVEAGLRVTIIESEFAGGGSTGAAMGHIVAMDDSPAQLALTAYSRRRWHEIGPSLPAAAEDDRCGTLWVGVNDDELANAADRITAYAAHGVRAELIDGTDLTRLEPALRPGLAGGLLVPDDGVCYPPAIARHLVQRAVERGATLRGRVTVASIDRHQVVFGDGSRVAAGTTVVAAGVSSPSLLPGLPVVPRKGHLVITDRHPGMVHRQVLELGYMQSAHTFGAASVAFNVQPRRTGQLLIGSSRELVGLDPRLNRHLMGAMLERATRFVPGLAQTRAVRCWVGFRPATPDKLPLIGPWPEIDDVWVATGHEGLGITLAPGTADLIVSGVTGTQPPVDPRPFLPDRPMQPLEAAHA